MTLALHELDDRTYRPHALHGEARMWQETNCYVDLWIELLHALGHDPHGMLGCAFESAFEADQWLFFKPAASDLFALYGVDLQELTIWRALQDHAERQLAAGRLLLVEVDAFHLPDTRGVSYREQHKKTTIAIARIDVARRSLAYFHNAGFFTLSERDFDGVFAPSPSGLPPYTEFVRLGMGPALEGPALASRARALLAGHLLRAPRENPIARYRPRFGDDLSWLAGRPPELFHEYAFASLRQLGAAFELGGSYLAWLVAHGEHDLTPAVAHCEVLATGAKTLQFKAARAVMRGRLGDFAAQFDELEAAWDALFATLRRTSA
jgi:hypothetical protein